jgi:hypothetical protein
MGTPLSIERTKALAYHYGAKYFRGVPSVEDPAGRNMSHMVWMLNRIIDEDIPLDKASRWIGFIQGMLVGHRVVTLDEVKSDVRDASNGLFDAYVTQPSLSSEAVSLLSE